MGMVDWYGNGKSIVWGDNSTGYLCEVCGTDGLSFEFGHYPKDCPVCESEKQGKDEEGE
jgi:rubrerythrin